MKNSKAVRFFVFLSIILYFSGLEYKDEKKRVVAIDKSVVGEIVDNIPQTLHPKMGSNLSSEIERQVKATGLKDNSAIIRILVEMENSVNQGLSIDNLVGGRITGIYGNLVAVELSSDLVSDFLDKNSGIRYARLPQRFYPSVIRSEGVELTSAVDYHLGGVKGQGVKVAVIDLGFKGLEDLKKCGELPENVVTKDFTGRGIEKGSKHGAGCAEIVYDMAPHAELLLVKIYDELDFYKAIDFCIEEGVDVISMSLGSFGTGPGNGTGPQADACKKAQDNGILVVVSAGNSGIHAGRDRAMYGYHWKGEFNDLLDDDYHYFDSHENARVSIVGAYPDQDDDGEPVFGEVSVILRWDDYPHVGTDYNMALIDLKTQKVVASSNVDQSAGHLPMESIVLDIPDNEQYEHMYGLVITKTSSSPSGREIEVHLQGNCYFSSKFSNYYATSESSLSEPADSPSVLTVGAMDYRKWESGPQESFSSQGPTNAWQGVPAINKPDLVGPDRVLTRTYGETGFSGTSAAAPHVAGLSALLLSRQRGLNPDQLKSCLKRFGDKSNLPKVYPVENEINIYGSGRSSLPKTIPMLDTDSDLVYYWEMLRDPVRNRVYLFKFSPSDSKLSVIDTEQEKIIKEITIEDAVGLGDISDDGSMMAVLCDDELVLLNLSSFEWRALSTFHSFRGYKSVAFGEASQLFVLPKDYNEQKLGCLNIDTGALTQWIPLDSQLEYADYAKLKYNGGKLYMVSRKENEATLVRLDMSRVEDPQHCFSTIPNASSDFEFLYGSGDVVWGKWVLDGNNLEIKCELPVESNRYDYVETSMYDGLIHLFPSEEAAERVEGDDFSFKDSVNFDIVKGTVEKYSSKFKGMDRRGSRYYMQRTFSYGYYNSELLCSHLNGSEVRLTLPEIVREGEGVIDGKGKLELFRPAEQDMRILLLSSDPGSLTVPHNIVIAKGKDTAEFDIIVADNELLDGHRSVRVSAESDLYHTVVQDILIRDDEDAEITLHLPEVVNESETERTYAGHISLSRPVDRAHTLYLNMDLIEGMDNDLTLSKDDTHTLSYPTMLVLPAGEQEVKFEFKVLDNSYYSESVRVVFSATMDHWKKGEAEIVIQDDDTQILSMDCPDVLFPGDEIDITVNLSERISRTLDIDFETSLPQAVSFSVDYISLWPHSPTGRIRLKVAGDRSLCTASTVDLTARIRGVENSSFTRTVKLDRFRMKTPELKLHDTLHTSFSVSKAFDDGQTILLNMGQNGMHLLRLSQTGELLSEPVQICEAGRVVGDPDLLKLSQNRMGVVWCEENEKGMEINVQLFDINGQFIAPAKTVSGDEFLVNKNPQAAVLSDGTFVVMWCTGNNESRDDGLFAVHCDVDGNRLEGPFRVTPEDALYIGKPDISALPGGGFAIVWSHITTHTPRTGYLQCYSALCEEDGDSIRLFSRKKYIENSQVKVLADGKMVVAWEASLGLYNIKKYIECQLISPDRKIVGEPFLISSNDPSYCGELNLISLQRGGFVAAWKGENNLFMNIFDLCGSSVSGIIRVPKRLSSAYSYENPYVVDLRDGTLSLFWMYRNRQYCRIIESGLPESDHCIGDLNGDMGMTLDDVIIGMKVQTGKSADNAKLPSVSAGSEGDSVVGLKDVIHSLRVVSGQRRM